LLCSNHAACAFPKRLARASSHAPTSSKSTRGVNLAGWGSTGRGASVGSEQFVDGRHRGSLAESFSLQQDLALLSEHVKEIGDVQALRRSAASFF
jgi:hypothetical protein